PPVAFAGPRRSPYLNRRPETLPNRDREGHDPARRPCCVSRASPRPSGVSAASPAAAARGYPAVGGTQDVPARGGGGAVLERAVLGEADRGRRCREGRPGRAGVPWIPRVHR